MCCNSASKATVIAIGPGLSSDDERTRRFVHEVVKQRKTPVVIDADGLNCLAPWPIDLQGSAGLPLILTPHPGEMLRLLGTTDKSVLDDRVAAAREFATKHHADTGSERFPIFDRSAGWSSIHYANW